jgi:hypothetical protein
MRWLAQREPVGSARRSTKTGWRQRRPVIVGVAVFAAASVLGVLGAAPAALGAAIPEPPAPLNAGVQQIKVIDGGNSLTAVSCAAVAWCAVGDGNGKVIMELSGTWQKPVQVFPAGDGVTGVSCPTTAFCMAVAYIGGWSEYSGGKWSAPKTSMTSGGGWGVSCASSSLCMAEDGAWGDIDEWNGAKWTFAYDGEADAHDGLGQSSAPISCLTGATSPCMYITNGDYANNWNGKKWSATAAVAKSGAEGMVSCSEQPRTTVIFDERVYPATSESECQVVDTDGHTYWWNGGGFASLGTPDTSSTFDTFEGLSCTYYLCAAVDGDGNVLYEAIASGGAGAWSKPYSMSTSGVSVAISCASYTFCLAVTSAGEAVTLDPQLPSKGYWLASSDGTVVGFGGAHSLGGANGASATDPVVGIAATPSGNGYFVVTRNGTVTARGDAVGHGDLPGIGVSVSDVVGIAPTSDGKGYWLIAADGGEFAFGDAHYHGSLPGIGIHVHDIVGMVATPGGSGYLIVGADGGVFAFGAHYHGSLPALGIRVDDIVGILPTGGESGYVLVGKDGGAFVFGHGSGYYGSLPGEHVDVSDVVGIGLTPDQHGYWMCEASGTVHAFGDASVYVGSASVDTPVAAIAGT